MDEPPAVVALLVDGGEVPWRALTATLLDLAAHGLVEVDAATGLVRLSPPAAPHALAAFEHRCLLLVGASAREWRHFASRRALGVSGRWWREFRTEVRVAATAADLLEPPRGRGPVRASLPVRLTPLGVDHGLRWSSAARSLDRHRLFVDEAPGTVAYWGRSLAYATAVGRGPSEHRLVDATRPLGAGIDTVAQRAALRPVQAAPGHGDTWWFADGVGGRAVVHRESSAVEAALPSALLPTGVAPTAPVAGVGQDARWIEATATLVAHGGDSVVVVRTPLANFTDDERLEVAKAFATAALAG